MKQAYGDRSQYASRLSSAWRPKWIETATNTSPRNAPPALATAEWNSRQPTTASDKHTERSGLVIHAPVADVRNDRRFGSASDANTKRGIHTRVYENT
jgi:hypothetical protein